jgi:hypothetical protein
VFKPDSPPENRRRSYNYASRDKRALQCRQSWTCKIGALFLILPKPLRGVKAMKTSLCGYFLLLLIVISSRVDAMPIHWTLEATCAAEPFTASLCGDFTFDLETGSYSDVGIIFGICDPLDCYYSGFDENFFFEGDQYSLTSGHSPLPQLYMWGYDLAVIAPQNFQWSVFHRSFGGGIYGSGSFSPDPPPPPVPVPATALLLGLALACGALLRRNCLR